MTHYYFAKSDSLRRMARRKLNVASSMDRTQDDDYMTQLAASLREEAVELYRAAHCLDGAILRDLTNVR